VTNTPEIQGQECDLLVLGAPESTLSAGSAGRVRAKIVIEAAELVVTPLGERSLTDRGVVVVPDLVGAAALLIAANAEWSNNVQHLSSDQGTPPRDIASGLLRTYEQVKERSLRENISTRLAAYSAAIERVARSERLRVA
jgi:glutamate dehydrogenase/leucine dehydrogenase